ncbi:MAG: hypothetical protein Q9172_006915 [Xanthocarpia lactea]
MDPLTPTTSTLTPAIAHIAETAASLAESLQNRNTRGNDPRVPEDTVMLKKERQRQTVRWVLAAPRRLKRLMEEDLREEAIKDWEEVQRLLEKWNGTQGVDEDERMYTAKYCSFSGG